MDWERWNSGVRVYTKGSSTSSDDELYVNGKLEMTDSHTICNQVARAILGGTNGISGECQEVATRILSAIPGTDQS